MFIRPNESDYKIYMIAQDMGTEGQNALLKILEEPPSYGLFLLLTENPDKILPTVRSRCTELKMTALPEAVLRQALRKKFPQAQEADITAAIGRSGGFLGQAQEMLDEGGAVPSQTEGFVRAFSSRDSLAMVQTLTPMEKWKRDALAPVLQNWLELVENALVCRSGMHTVSPLARQLAASRSSPELYAAAVALKKALEYTQGNVSPAAVCGWLTWELRK